MSYASRKKFDKKTILILAGACAVIAVVGITFGGVFKTEDNQVYVYNWGEYIDPEVITMFEEETGIKVIYDEFESNEIMYAKIASDNSAYDVICPSDYMISRMIQEGMLKELDWEELPYASANIDPNYLESAASFDEGNRYAVPNFCGTVGILYNKTLVDEPVTSWDILWDEKYAGQILMQDSVRDAFMVALARDGYSINSTDKAELEQAADDLVAQKPLVQAYVIDQVRDKMIGGEAALGVIYSGEALYTQRENTDLEYVVPEEGSNVWLDGWCITRDAKHTENALKWIDFMCREDIALMNFEYVTYTTPNLKAQELIEDETIRNSTVAFPDEDTLSRCEVYTYLGQDADALYNELWKKIKAAD